MKGQGTGRDGRQWPGKENRKGNRARETGQGNPEESPLATFPQSLLSGFQTHHFPGSAATVLDSCSPPGSYRVHTNGSHPRNPDLGPPMPQFWGKMRSGSPPLEGLGVVLTWRSPPRIRNTACGRQRLTHPPAPSPEGVNMVFFPDLVGLGVSLTWRSQQRIKILRVMCTR